MVAVAVLKTSLGELNFCLGTDRNVGFDVVVVGERGVSGRGVMRDEGHAVGRWEGVCRSNGLVKRWVTSSMTYAGTGGNRKGAVCYRCVVCEGCVVGCRKNDGWWYSGIRSWLCSG